jgi:uncharacterized protein
MTERRTVLDADGRVKAYRPLPIRVRAAAFEHGLAAYERGDFFEAHEDLEPAWMGTDDRRERAFLQGLIKLAAAYVHATRGNPPGIAKNLEGARRRLAEAAVPGADVTADMPGVGDAGIDLRALLDDVDLRLLDLVAHPTGPVLPPPSLHRSPR